MIFVQIVCFVICAWLVLILLPIALVCWRGLCKIALWGVLGVCMLALMGKPNHQLTPDDFSLIHTIVCVMGACGLALALLEYWPRKRGEQ